jgi:DNA-binding transcriptional ArsR family regulator
MTDAATERVTRLTDPKALRALAHPTRLALVGLLRMQGPLTATKAGELLGESSASASFHLRQLAKYGLVEEAGGGTGRERPWRASSMGTAWPDVADTAELAAATGMLRSVIVDRWSAMLRQWFEVRSGQPEEWQKAIPFGDTIVYATAAEIAEIAEQQRAALERYRIRQARPELRPAGARPVLYLGVAVPVDLPGSWLNAAGPAEVPGSGAGPGTP